MKRMLTCTAFLVISACAHAGDQILWDELTQGDLSDDRFAPTTFNLQPGGNVLFGQMDGPNFEGLIDRDYFSITVPAGHQLSEIRLSFYLSADFAAFVGIQPGSIFPDDPDLVQPGDLLGWTLIGPFQVGMDILPLMGQNGMGFTAPLPAGTYTFWAQQLDDFTEWAPNFIVEVPSPGSAIALFACAACPAARRRR